MKIKIFLVQASSKVIPLEKCTSNHFQNVNQKLVIKRFNYIVNKSWNN